jgi:hypothetical protein
MPPNKEHEATKLLMGALVRMKPKPHDEMKVRAKPTPKKKQHKKRKSVSS